MTNNGAVTTVAVAPSPATSGTSLTVAAGTGARLYPGLAALHPTGVTPTAANIEIVAITVAGDVVTLTRAQESSPARAVAVGDTLTQGITAGMWDAVVASSTATVPVSRGGTGGTDAVSGRAGLGLGTAAVMSPASLAADPAMTSAFARKASVPFALRPSGSRVRGAVFTADKSNGTDTGVNTRTAHRSPSFTPSLAVGWTNYAANGSAGETTADIGSLTIRAAIEYPSGSYWPLWFAGKRDIVVEPGGAVVSDELAVPGGIPAGAWYWVRSYVTVVSGQKWPNSSLNGGSPWFEASEMGTTQVDETTSGTIAFGGNKPIRPSVIRSRISQDALSLIGLGDSIICGVGDVDGSRGWFYYATDGTCHAAQMGCSGETMLSYTTGGMRTRLSLVAPGANASISAFVNDMSSGANLATLQSRALALWAGMQSLGLQAWHSTMTPTGVLTTDGYATTVNQSVIGTNAARIAFNTWLRDGAPVDPTTKAAVAVGTVGALRAAVYSQTATLVTGASGSGVHLLTGVVEFADCVESARDSGLWKPLGTTDGTHPVQSLHIAMGAAVPIAAMRAALGVTG